MKPFALQRERVDNKFKISLINEIKGKTSLSMSRWLYILRRFEHSVLRRRSVGEAFCHMARDGDLSLDVLQSVGPSLVS